MRFNSARPIKALTPKEQEGLRKLFFPTEQPEVSTRKLPIDPITPVTQEVLGFSHKEIRDTPDSEKIRVINAYYKQLISQIQDPTLLPPPVTKLRQNFPNIVR